MTLEVAVLAALQEACPEAATHKANGGVVPLHCAAALLDEVPAVLLTRDAAAAADNELRLPLHYAAKHGTATATRAVRTLPPGGECEGATLFLKKKHEGVRMPT